MSNQNWSSKSTAPKLEALQLSNKIVLEVPQDVLDKIKYLCRSISRVEWSGVLFYEVVGSIKDTANMKIVLKDILLMDKGTGSYTSFDWDEDVVAYRMDNPESLDWTIGHIHSHNTMDVFFSGTDWSELNDNCPNHNFYLSVIVNNYLDIVAKVAFTAESQRFVCKDENGRDYTLGISDSKIKPMMFVYDCQIITPKVELSVAENFIGRLMVIEKKEEERKRKLAAQAKQAQAQAQALATNNSKKSVVVYEGGKEKSPFPNYYPKSYSKQKHILQSELYREMAEQFHEEEEEDVVASLEQNFATYLLRLGNDEVIDDEIVDALTDLEIANLNTESFSTSIIETYGALYDRFFDGYTDYATDEVFLKTLEEVIEIYEGFEVDYPFLATVIARLKELGIKFENHKQRQDAK